MGITAINSRQQTTLQMVIDQGQANVIDLAKATGVSEVTICQDLNILEKLSHLRHAHSFAASLDSDDVGTRIMSNYTLRHEFVEFTASLVQLGETIFIENGSSNVLLIRTLGEQKKNTTIITISSYITHLLKDAPYEIILLDDVYQKKSGSMADLLTHRCIQQVHFSKAFIGTDGWQPKTGFTGHDTMRTDVVNAALEKEYETTALTDSSKFGAVRSHSIGPVEQFNRVAIDPKIRTSDLTRPEHSKLTIHVADI